MRALLRLLEHASPATALAAACRLAYARGLVAAAAGNASCRLPDGYLCTPTGCCLGEVGPGDLVMLDTRWQPTAAGRRPSSEWRLHAHAYQAAAGLRAVLHTHSPAATALAVLGEGLPPLTPEAEHFLGPVPCLPFSPPGSEQLGIDVGRAIAGGARAALLGRHGAVAWGEGVRRAWEQAELLESAASLFLAVAEGRRAQR